MEIEQETSEFYKISAGTVQGLVMGPLLFALFISPIYNLVDLTTFADDNYLLRGNANLDDLKTEMEQDTQRTFEWLTNSGLKVNANKTEFIVFSKQDAEFEVNIDGNVIRPSSSIRVLGAIFDKKTYLGQPCRGPRGSYQEGELWTMKT